MKNQVLELNSVSIEKIGIFGDRIEFFQANCAKSWVKLKTIESLIVNLGLNRINVKPRTKIKKVCKAKVTFEILTGYNCTKLKV